MSGLLGSPVFTQKVVFKAQTERKVSQWENKLKVNTGAQVWEVCLFSLPGTTPHPTPVGLKAGNPLAGRGEVWVWSGPATAEPHVSKCGLRTRARCKLLARAHDETRAGIESKPL